MTTQQQESLEKPMLVTTENWSMWAKRVAYPADPEEYVEASAERLMRVIDDYVITIKGLRPQFKTYNRCQMINFRSYEDEKKYQTAYERYLEKKGQIEAEGGNRFDILVQFLKFRQAAELIRAPDIADAMVASVEAGKAALAAVNFKATIVVIVKRLMEHYKIPRKKISLIWGGSSTFTLKKEDMLSKEQLRQFYVDMAMGKKMDRKLTNLVEKQMELAGSELLDEFKDLDSKMLEEMNLGVQSRKERNREIKRFQRGKSLFCIFTFKSGGVGLSFHHSDDFTKEKVRRKESGYAVEEDIPLIPVRPREVFLAPTYSDIEIVQGLGRAPRLTSLSDTSQTILFYRGTIEVRVFARVSMKLKCLKEIVRQKESWMDAINEPVKYIIDDINESVVTVEDSDNYLITGGDSDEEEGENGEEQESDNNEDNDDDDNDGEE